MTTTVRMLPFPKEAEFAFKAEVGAAFHLDSGSNNITWQLRKLLYSAVVAVLPGGLRIKMEMQ